jgi:MFS family permease
MLMVSLGSLASQWPLGWISDRSDRRITILGSTGGAAAAAAVIAVIPEAGPLLFVFSFLFGAFCMPLYSLNIALFNDRLSAAEMVHAASALVVYYGLGSALGPFGASLIMSRIGPGGLFLFLGIVLALFFILGTLRVASVPLRAKRDQDHYHTYPRTTFAAFKLLRRSGGRRRRRSLV